jgi:hypothetical protein
MLFAASISSDYKVHSYFPFLRTSGLAVLDKDGRPLLNAGAGVDFVQVSSLQNRAIVGNSADKRVAIR